VLFAHPRCPISNKPPSRGSTAWKSKDRLASSSPTIAVKGKVLFMICAIYFLKVVNSAKKQKNTQVRFSKNTFWFLY
jgi:hypothetical protein